MHVNGGGDHLVTLIRSHSRHRTVSGMGRAIGNQNLPRALRDARRSGRLPRLELLAGIAGELEGADLLDVVVACSRDAGYEMTVESSWEERHTGRAVGGLPEPMRTHLVALVGDLVAATRRH